MAVHVAVHVAVRVAIPMAVRIAVRVPVQMSVLKSKNKVTTLTMQKQKSTKFLNFLPKIYWTFFR